MFWPGGVYMSESSFTVLREIGSLPVSNGSEVRFSIDVYRNYRYVSIRRYVNMDGLWAPTRDGLTLTPEIVRVLAPKIGALSDTPKEIANGPLGKFAKRPGICVVVEVGSFRNERGVALRQWEEAGGWTKKGIWLPLEKIKEIKALFKATHEAIDEQPEDDF